MNNVWKEEDVLILKKEYPHKKAKDLAKELKKTESTIRNKVFELKLKKAKEFYLKRRKYNSSINKEKLEDLYNTRKISIRKISKELKIPKSTLEYYLKIYGIKRRSKSEANKERFKWDTTWSKGKSKEIDLRLKETSKSLRKSWKNRKLKLINELGIKFNTHLATLLNKFYWEDRLSLEEIGKKIGLGRRAISNLFKEYDLSLRPNFQYIASLKGVNHPHFGKSWEELFGVDKAKELREKTSIRSRKLIIERITSNNFPFLNTKIELAIAKEMRKRNLPFINQFEIDNRFVCDFAIPSSKLIIECDGDYWHGNPKVYNEENLTKGQKVNLYRDKVKDAYLKEKGWKVLRFFESDIKASPSKCVDTIERNI